MIAIYVLVVAALFEEFITASYLPFSSSCEEIYNKNVQSRVRPGYYWTLDASDRLYCGMNYTGSSCREIYDVFSETRTKSGYYRIRGEWKFCNMRGAELEFMSACPGAGGEWKRIARFDITVGDNCPAGWIKASSGGVSFCRIATDASRTCSSVFFSTNGKRYQSMCGRVRGYQKGGPGGFAGFYRHRDDGIDSSYIDGISITRGSPREHVWTYVIGTSDDYNYPSWNCPCASIAGPVSPSFVGEHYYCESGDTGSWSSTPYYFNDILWDGVGCSKSHCCTNYNTLQPWFYRFLRKPSSDDIEVRICAEWGFPTAATLVDYLELYIQ